MFSFALSLQDEVVSVVRLLGVGGSQIASYSAFSFSFS